VAEPTIIYAQVVPSDDQSAANGDVPSLNGTYHNDTAVIYSHVSAAQDRDLSDLYTKVSR